MDVTDETLIDQIAAGDRAAFRALYQRYEKPVHHFIKRRLGDPHESADVFHEVMMQVWRSAAGFQGRSRASSWLFGIAHNKTIDFLRSRGRRDWDVLEEEPADDAPTEFQRMAAIGDAKILRECMAKLDDAKREVVEMIFGESMLYREVSEALDVPEGTLKARVHRSLRQLRDCVTRRGLRSAGGEL